MNWVLKKEEMSKTWSMFPCGQEEGRWRVTVSCPGFCYCSLPFIPPSVHVRHAFQVPPVCDVCDENMADRLVENLRERLFARTAITKFRRRGAWRQKRSHSSGGGSPRSRCWQVWFLSKVLSSCCLFTCLSLRACGSLVSLPVLIKDPVRLA